MERSWISLINVYHRHSGQADSNFRLDLNVRELRRIQDLLDLDR